MRRAAAVLLLAAVAVALPASSAGAHAMLSDATPEDGAVLEDAPHEVVLTFTEPVDPALSRVEVRDSTGAAVDTGPAETLPGDAAQLRVTLPELADDAYTITYQTLSTVDGHVTSGALAFAVGLAAVLPAAAPADTGAMGAMPTPSVLAVAGRWTLYWGLALLLSGAVVGLVVFAGSLPAGRWALIVPLALAVIGLLAVVLAESRAAQVDPVRLLSTATGVRWLREAGALALTAVMVAGAVAIRGRVWLALLALAAAGTMLAHTLSGHAGAPDELRWVNIGVQWVHLAAVGIWIGGLAWLLLGLRGGEREERARAVRRFSTVATFALGPLALTGVLRALDLVGGWEKLVGSGYGRSVLAKAGLFLPLLVLGALNRYRVVPNLSTDGSRFGTLRRNIRGELLIAAGLLGVTGVMAGLPPSASVGAHDMSGMTAAAAGMEASGSDFATSARATLLVSPGTVGPNRFDLTITDYDSGQPLEARRVTLQFSLPGKPEIAPATLELAEQGPGRWSAQGIPLSIGGRWDVVVMIEQAADSLQVPLEVEPRGVEHVQVDMVSFAFQPATLEFSAGDTVRFRFTNSADIVHEGVIGDAEYQAEHEQEMTEDGMEGMEGTGDAIEVPPGETGELTYTFDEPGTLFIGCHQPGHWDAGMKATITVR